MLYGILRGNTISHWKRPNTVNKILSQETEANSKDENAKPVPFLTLSGSSEALFRHLRNSSCLLVFLRVEILVCNMNEHHVLLKPGQCIFLFQVTMLEMLAMKSLYIVNQPSHLSWNKDILELIYGLMLLFNTAGIKFMTAADPH